MADLVPGSHLYAKIEIATANPVHSSGQLLQGMGKTFGQPHDEE